MYRQTSLDFFGYTFSDGGFSPDPTNLKALQEAAPSKNVNEVCSLLGKAIYSARFIKDFASITQPLLELTRKHMTWTWSQTHQDAFQRLKQSLSCGTVMHYFDPRKQTELVVNASPVGLGEVLAQRDSPHEPAQVVSYASRALSDTEQKYSQTEREALAIVWACKHFHMYLYGSQFTLVTDHKPNWDIQQPKVKATRKNRTVGSTLAVIQFHCSVQVRK